MADVGRLIVVGGGIGGYTAAIRAARSGIATTLVERGALGGTCLNVGCIPTKSLLHNARAYRNLLSWRVGRDGAVGHEPDLAHLMGEKDAAVSCLVRGVETLVKRNAITLVTGTAALDGPRSVRIVESGDVLEADAIVLATGSEPVRPPIAGHDLPGVIVSDDAIALQAVPKRVTIVGGGVIGVEFGQIFSDLGASVTIVELADRMLAGEDPEIVDVLVETLRARGVSVQTKCRVLGIARESDGLVTRVEHAGAVQDLKSDLVLLAVGRKPNLIPGLEAAGVMHAGGVVKVDEWQRTNVPSIYAVGDVCGGPLLAHKAAAEAEVAVAHFHGHGPSMRERAIPRAVYTSPEIASVGLSESEARARGPVRIGRFPFASNGKALVSGHAEGLIKVVADAEHEQILGVHMVGPDVTNLLGEATLVVQMELTLAAVAETIHAHPTLSEALAEAAQDARDCGAIHLPPRKRA